MLRRPTVRRNLGDRCRSLTRPFLLVVERSNRLAGHSERRCGEYAPRDALTDRAPACTVRCADRQPQVEGTAAVARIFIGRHKSPPDFRRHYVTVHLQNTPQWPPCQSGRAPGRQGQDRRSTTWPCAAPARSGGATVSVQPGRAWTIMRAHCERTHSGFCSTNSPLIFSLRNYVLILECGGTGTPPSSYIGRPGDPRQTKAIDGKVVR